MATGKRKFKMFGLREVHIAELLTDDATKLEYSDLEKAEGVVELSCAPLIEEYELVGDDQILESDAVLMGYDFNATNQIVTMEQLRILTGAAYEDVLDAEGQVIGEQSISNKDDRLPYFGMIGRVVKDGTTKMVFYKCKATGGVEIGASNGEYAQVSFSGKALATSHNGNFRKIRNVSIDEPVTLADFQED